jgi:hypothetical protein
MKHISIVVVLCGMALAGCSGSAPGDVAVLPTLAQLPTVTATLPPTLTATPSVTSAFTTTASPTGTATATLSVTPSATITDTPTLTPSHTPTITNTPEPPADIEGISALVELARQATVLPPALQPVIVLTNPPLPGATLPPVSVPVTCTTTPGGGFVNVFAADPTLSTQLGCATLGPLVGSGSASQPYERGEMIWVGGAPSYIYVFLNTGRYQRYDDTFNAAVDPVSGGEAPPAGLIEPVRGFGKVWRSFADVRANIGWALGGENAGQATYQPFERGLLLYPTQRGVIFVLVADAPGASAGTWRSVSGSF